MAISASRFSGSRWPGSRWLDSREAAAKTLKLPSYHALSSSHTISDEKRPQISTDRVGGVSLGIVATAALGPGPGHVIREIVGLSDRATTSLLDGVAGACAAGTCVACKCELLCHKCAKQADYPASPPPLPSTTSALVPYMPSRQLRYTRLDSRGLMASMYLKISAQSRFLPPKTRTFSRLPPVKAVDIMTDTDGASFPSAWFPWRTSAERSDEFPNDPNAVIPARRAKVHHRQTRTYSRLPPVKAADIAANTGGPRFPPRDFPRPI
ncbi:hypothetical protein DFH09DRAFT_1114142 [Mycena vulgaris]|nr:hypothetical protein DFH09DRAFT_1114142 [Mycena vulgaris]